METQRDWELLCRTPGQYSMEVARRLLAGLEQDGCTTKDTSWKRGDGNLVEVGIEVKCDSCALMIMCSYEDIFVKRVSGNKARYYELCEHLRQRARDNA
jgi:hypothetical protein